MLDFVLMNRKTNHLSIFTIFRQLSAAMDFRVICRICLESNKQTCDLFSSYYLKRNILFSEMLSSCTKLKPNTQDGLPRLICKECTKQLKRAFTFNLLCEESNKTLTSYLRSTQSDHNKCNNNGDVVKDEHSVKEEDCKNESIEFEVDEILDQDDGEAIKDDIKLEPNYNDISFWDADDNILLGDIKLNPEDAENETIQSENLEPLKKKTGKKQKVEPDQAKDKTPHQCDICGKLVTSRSNLKSHKLSHTDLRPFPCTECPATFRAHSALFQHRRIHTGEKPYHCEYCPKQFSRRSGLINHIRMHTGEKHFSCSVCYKAFVQSAQLSIHMKRHNGDKPFLCQDCGKGFPIKADLRVHMRTHNGEKPYSCHLCTKTFANSGNLSMHIRIHKKEIRYNCKECQRGFVTPSSYSVHLKRHKGQRDYHCECGKTFYTSSALKQHKVVHTGEKKYQCKICDRKFTQTSHLSRHCKKDHAKSNPISHDFKGLSDGKPFGLINAIGSNSPVKCEGLV